MLIPMVAYALDTLKSVDRLKGAKVPEDQARAFVEVFQEIQQGADLATKADLEQFRVATKADINEVRSEMCEMDARVGGKITLLQWMVGASLTLNIAILIKLLFT